MSRKWTILLVVLVLGLGLDVLTKVLVLEYIPLESGVHVVPGFFNVVHVHNKAAAFGLLSGVPAVYTRIFFIFTSGLVLAVVGYLWWRLPEASWQTALGYSLVTAGALGNMADRVRLGWVVDFLDVYWGRYHWPAFNVADIMVCLGAGLLILVILREEKHSNAANPV
jgi:signal peptidase II